MVFVHVPHSPFTYVLCEVLHAESALGAALLYSVITTGSFAVPLAPANWGSGVVVVEAPADEIALELVFAQRGIRVPAFVLADPDSSRRRIWRAPSIFRALLSICYRRKDVY